MQHKDEALLEELRHAPRCEACGVAIVGQAEPHHMIRKGMGGGRQLDVRFNLIPLCHFCHASHHDRLDPTMKELWDKIAAREGVEPGSPQRAMGQLAMANADYELCHDCEGASLLHCEMCNLCYGTGILLNGEPYENAEAAYNAYRKRPAVDDDLEHGQGQDPHDGLPPAASLPGAVGETSLESNPRGDEWIAF